MLCFVDDSFFKKWKSELQKLHKKNKSDENSNTISNVDRDHEMKSSESQFLRLPSYLVAYILSFEYFGDLKNCYSK